MNKFLNSAIMAVTVIAGYTNSALASIQTEPVSVPEPTALGLLTMGVAGIVLARRLRKQ